MNLSDSTKKPNRSPELRIADAILTSISRVLHALSGVHHACRFQPTCHRYFLEAIEKRGVIVGGWLSIKRLFRCHPWGNWGIDPVPGESK